jgi:hypothetical protein
MHGLWETKFVNGIPGVIDEDGCVIKAFDTMKEAEDWLAFKQAEAEENALEVPIEEVDRMFEQAS